MAAPLRSYVVGQELNLRWQHSKAQTSLLHCFWLEAPRGQKVTKADKYFKVHCDKSEILLLFSPFYLSWVVFASTYALIKYVFQVHQYTHLGWTSTPLGTMVKIPKSISIFLDITNIALAWTRLGSLSSNLTFFGLNMATKRPHSKRWMYQSRFTMAHNYSSGTYRKSMPR